MTLITVICDNPDCNNIVELKPSQIDRKYHFCCNACRCQWLSKRTGDKNPSKRPEVREKISAARKGHEVTPETREKLAKANIGRKDSEETRIK